MKQIALLLSICLSSGLFRQPAALAEGALWEQDLARAEKARSLQQLKVAEQYCDAALKQVEASGTQSRELASVLNEQVVILLGLHKYSQAEDTARRALAIREKLLGLSHVDTAQSFHNLAQTLMDEKKYDEAESNFQQALSIFEAGHYPRLSLTLEQLANLYAKQGKYAAAEPLYKRAVDMYEGASGPMSMQVGKAVWELAELYKKEGKLAPAEPLYRRCLEITQSDLGVDHPFVAYRLNELGMLYVSLGKYSAAEPYLHRACELRQKRLAAGSPLLSESRANLAALYRAQGRSREADELLSGKPDINLQATQTEKPAESAPASGPDPYSSPVAATTGSKTDSLNTAARPVNPTGAQAALPADKLYERLSPCVFKVETYDAGAQHTANGSAVAISGNRLVSNKHVAVEGSSVKITQAGKSWNARLVRVHPFRDLVELEVAGLNAPAPVVRSSSSLKVGERVYTIGAPEGLEQSLAEGIISSLRKNDSESYIQTTAAISHGSSGGGLFDCQGRLVGITTMLMPAGQALNFAIPAEVIGELERYPVNAQSDETDASLRARMYDQLSVSKHKLAPEDTGSQSYIEAINYQIRSLKLKSDNAVGWFHLGSCYLVIGSYDNALNAYAEALKFEPKYARCYYGQAVALAYKGKDAEANAALEKLRQLDANLAVQAAEDVARAKSEVKGSKQTADTSIVERKAPAASTPHVSTGKAERAVNLPAYVADVENSIKKHWHPPKVHASKNVVVSFDINTSGTISQLKIKQSSGIDEADRAALQAVQAAAPFPALPSGAPTSVSIEYSFDYNVHEKGADTSAGRP